MLKKTIHSALRICASAVILLLAGQSLQAGEITLTQQSYQVPVLIKKKDNPVLRINISLPADTAVAAFSEMVFSLNGTTDLKDIKQVRLYYAGKDGATKNLISTDLLMLVGSTDRITSTITIKGALNLGAGNNNFWLALELNDDADQLHRITVNVVTATLDGHLIKNITANAMPLRIGYALRQHNQDNVHTSRIPGLSTAKDGSLLAIYDARRESARDLQGNIDIGLTRSTDKGKTWLPMQVAIDMGTWGGLPQKFNGVSDPNILVDKRTGNIFIAGLWMHGLLDSTGKWIEGLTDTSTLWNHQWKAKGSQPGFDVKQSSQFLIVKSTDNGKTWSQPVNLTKQLKQEDWWLIAPAPGAGITLQDGTLVFPTEGRDHTGRVFSNITWSKDGGATWHTSHKAMKEPTTENMAVELTDGSIMLNMRCNLNGKDTGSTNGRFIAVTSDLGATWKEHPTSRGALPEPVCMGSIIRHDYIEKGNKRSILVFANPDSKTIRHHMTIKVSYDDGKTWVDNKKILLDVGKSRGYSCLTSIDNDTIGILYESSQADMVFQKISVKELL